MPFRLGPYTPSRGLAWTGTRHCLPFLDYSCGHLPAGIASPAKCADSGRRGAGLRCPDLSQGTDTPGKAVQRGMDGPCIPSSHPTRSDCHITTRWWLWKGPETEQQCSKQCAPRQAGVVGGDRGRLASAPRARVRCASRSCPPSGMGAHDQPAPTLRRTGVCVALRYQSAGPTDDADVDGAANRSGHGCRRGGAHGSRCGGAPGPECHGQHPGRLLARLHPHAALHSSRRRQVSRLWFC